MTHTKDEALVLALEVLQINLTLLKKINPYKGQEDLLSDSLDLTHRAVTAIKQSLASPAQPAHVPLTWQSMESAPKDGAEILLYSLGDVGVCYWRDDEVMTGWTWGAGKSFELPTHWMPIPGMKAAQPAPVQETKKSIVEALEAVAAYFYDGPVRNTSVVAACEKALNELAGKEIYKSWTPKDQAKLEDIEQYRMQMAGISTAAIGYWKEGDSIHPDYDTTALRDVAKLYARYAALYTTPPAAEPVQPEQPAKGLPYGYVSTHTNGLIHFNRTLQGVYTDTATEVVAVYTTPPAAQPADKSRMDIADAIKTLCATGELPDAFEDMADWIAKGAMPTAQPAQEPVAQSLIDALTHAVEIAEAKRPGTWDELLQYRALLATPPTKPAVPDAIHHTDLSENMEHIRGWNECRELTIQMQITSPTKQGGAA
jgi:hypothetical protein